MALHDFSAVERQLLERSADVEVTRRRIRATHSAPTRPMLAAMTTCLVWCSSCAPGDTPPQQADAVFFTWLSNTTWLIEVGETRVFADAAISRLPIVAPTLSEPETLTPPPVTPDTALVRTVLAATGTDGGPTYIMVGHTHSDHTIDLGPIARMTDAEIIGPRTACLQAQAQGIAPERCTAVEGGEVVALGPGLQVRVIRWAHSGDPRTRLGRFIQAPKELIEPPWVDPETGAMYPGPTGGFPNGGGARAYLFTYDSPDGPIRWLASDTGNQFTFDSIPTIGRDYLADEGLSLDMLQFVSADGSPRQWLARALEADGSNAVDLWLTYGGSSAHVRQVMEYLHPAAAIPHHWGGVVADYSAGVPRPYGNANLEQYLDSAGVVFLPQRQYLERYRLTTGGLERVSNATTQAALGLPAGPPEGG